MTASRIWTRIALGAGMMMALGAQTCQLPPGGGLFDLPRGSYAESCGDIRVAPGNILVAACRDRRGRYAETTLRLPCRGDIANEGGQLVCRADDTGFDRVPEGSYRAECRSERVEGRTLMAVCPDRRGRMLESSLRLPCRDDIANDNGQLVCGRPDDADGPPPRGSYLETCDNARVRDNILIARCQTLRGGLARTELDLPCRGDIRNDDGRLVCGRDDDRAPPGSYRDSCRGERVERGGILVADCRDRRGRYVESSLRLPCYDDIANRDGELVCGGGYGGGYDGGYGGGYGSAEPPRGRYEQSCANIEVVRGGTLLVAQCRDTTGRFVETRLSLPCDGDIANYGGRLVCRRY